MSKIKKSLSRRKMYLNSPDKLFIADSEISYYKLSQNSYVNESVNVESQYINQKFEIDSMQGYYKRNPVNYLEINRSPMGMVHSLNEEMPGYSVLREENFNPVKIDFKHGLIHRDDDKPALVGRTSLVSFFSKDLYCVKKYNEEYRRFDQTLNFFDISSHHSRVYFGKYSVVHYSIFSRPLEMEVYCKNGMIHRNLNKGPALIIKSVKAKDSLSRELNIDISLYAYKGLLLFSKYDANNLYSAKEELNSPASKDKLKKLKTYFNANQEYMKKCDKICEQLPEELSFLQYSS